MNINKTKTILIVVLINLLVISISFIMYYVFITTFERKYEESYIYAYQPKLEEKITLEFEELNNIFKSETNKHDLITLNNLVDDQNSILHERGFLNFSQIDNSRFTYLSTTVNINNSYLKDYGFGFFVDEDTQYLYYYKDNIAGIIAFDNTFKEIVKITNANDVILMSNQGEIYFNYDKTIYKNVLHEYIVDENTNDYFIDYFSKKVNVEISTVIGGKGVTLVFTPIAEFDNLYIAQQFYKDDIQTEFANLHMFMVSIFIILALFNILILMFIFYYLNKRNSDIERIKLRHYYDKPYVIKINRKGKIIKANNRFNEDLLYEGLTNVTQLFRTEEDLLEKINRGLLLVYTDESLTLGFLSIKATRGFYLIGDFLKGSSATNDEAYQLAYFNQYTGFGNYHFFNKRINLLLDSLSTVSEENIYFIGLQVSEHESISAYLGKTLNLVYKKFATDLEKQTHGFEASFYSTTIDKTVIVISNTTFKEVEQLTNKIINYFEKPIAVGDNKIDYNLIGAIIPVSSLNKQFLNADIISDQLDETLKRAKQSATKKYMLFDETITHFLTERQQVEKDLEEAIRKKQFIPFFQAQYNYKEDRIDGFEALIRWDHPNYFKKSPQLFLEIAEQTELIDQIGYIMMDKTFKAAAELQEYNITVSINVSPNQMLSQGFTDSLLALYKKYNLKENSIAIEITENTLLKSFRLANDKIKILKNNGIRVDLDDFGTGYSSLPYIKELNFDTIKIDKTFVDYVETDRYNKAIVQMIVSLGKTLNATIIAEGVETKRQMDYLVRAGCQLIQGFYISRPVPLGEAIQLLEDYNVNKTKSFKEKEKNK